MRKTGSISYRVDKRSDNVIVAKIKEGNAKMLSLLSLLDVTA
jgi:hypothetical protein